MDIKIFKDNEKLQEAYNRLLEKINFICEEYQLSYFEIYGIMEAIKCDLYSQSYDEEDLNGK